jgi:hypothetical protein
MVKVWNFLKNVSHNPGYSVLLDSQSRIFVADESQGLRQPAFDKCFRKLFQGRAAQILESPRRMYLHAKDVSFQDELQVLFFFLALDASRHFSLSLSVLLFFTFHSATSFLTSIDFCNRLLNCLLIANSKYLTFFVQSLHC